MKDGLSVYCKSCKKEMDHEWRLNNKDTLREISRRYVDKNRIKLNKYSRQWSINNHLKILITTCQCRARKNNVPYDSTEILYSYLQPVYDKGECEICHKNLKLGTNLDKDDSPSIDRIIPEKGYVIGNVAVLCYRCNVIKNCGSQQDHFMIANWLKEKENIVMSKNNQIGDE
jgi:hypothetical protein